jgi:putative membrane protein
MINTLAVLIAVYLVRGINYQKPLDLLVASLLLGTLNSVIRPVLVVMALPLLIFTLGLFLLVINAGVLYFVGFLLRPHFYVQDFRSAFWGALVISIVSVVLNSLTGTGNTRVKIQRKRESGKARGNDHDVIDI